MRVSAMSDDFEHSVLASRLNSCDRKSSLRPDRLARRHQRARLLHMGVQPVQFLAHVGLDRQQRRFLRQAVFRHAAAGEHFLDLRRQPVAQRLRLRRGERAGLARQPLDLVHLRGQHRVQLVRLRWRARATSASNAVARVSRIAASRIAALRRLDRQHFVLHDHALEREQSVDARRRQAGFGRDFLRDAHGGGQRHRIDLAGRAPLRRLRPSAAPGCEPRLKRSPASVRAAGSMPSKPGGVRRRRSRPRPLTLLASQRQRAPSRLPCASANPVMLTMAMATPMMAER